ncbi:MAG: ATP-binding protein, partial [Actinomycetota bacterium]
VGLERHAVGGVPYGGDHPQPVVGADRAERDLDQLDRTITDLRSTIFHLTTPIGSASTQLQECVAEAADRLGHEPTLQVIGDLDAVAPAVLDELVPTLSEALSNVARHAQATATEVTIDIGAESVVLTVTDDGVGIDPTAPRGNGLTNVEARAELLGGVASITSSVTEGTTLTWTAPRP